MTRKAILAGLAAIAASAGMLSIQSPAQAAPQQHKHCLLAKAGEQMVCASSATELKAMAPEAEVPVLSIYSWYDYTGEYQWTYYREPCTPEVGGDADYVLTIGVLLYQNVSSVTKHTEGHCDWRLVDGYGVWSQSVETSWADLRTLGVGWNDRAVKIRLD